MELKYSLGDKNVVAYVLSHLEVLPFKGPAQHYLVAWALSTIEIQKEPEFESKMHQQCFYNYKITLEMDNEVSDDIIPNEYSTLISEQRKKLELQGLLSEKASYHGHTFHAAGEQWNLVYQGKDHRIVIPNSLQYKVIDWYHTTLVHSGRHRTE